MKLLPRRATTDVPEETDAVVEPAVPSGAERSARTAAPKGRPTPKRRDATGTRGPAAPPPRTRKEAYRYQKEQAARSRTSTVAGGQSRQAYREALRRGDPASLPRRDQGELKALARDYVDTRVMLSNFLLLAFIPLLLGPFVSGGNATVAAGLQAATVAILLVVVGEWYLTGRKLRAIGRERGYPVTGSVLGLGFYAGSRAYLPRRWRLPQPRKARGDAI